MTAKIVPVQPRTVERTRGVERDHVSGSGKCAALPGTSASITCRSVSLALPIAAISSRALASDARTSSATGSRPPHPPPR